MRRYIVRTRCCIEKSLSRCLAEPVEPRRLLAAIASDETVTASISALGEVDSYTITLAAGDTLAAIVAETSSQSFSPRMRILAPGGAELGAGAHGSGLRLKTVPAASAGTFTVEVSDDGSNHTGNYAITVVRGRGAQAPNDSHGGLIRSGERKTGTIGLGDQDVFQMQVTQGDRVVIALAETANASFWGGIEAYGPDGAPVADANDNAGTRVTFLAATTGTYTFVVYDAYGYYAGNYGLSAFKSTGTQFDDETDDDFASLRSGERDVGLMGLGDMDVFQMQIAQGDTVVIALAEIISSSFWGRVTAFGPDGSEVDTAADNAGTRLRFQAAAGGTYTFVVWDDYGYYTGTYGVAAFRSTGTQQDDLTDADFSAIRSGERKQGHLNVGDLDVFQMQITQGDEVILSLAETASASIWSRVIAFGPDGSLITEAADNAGTRIDFQAAVSGTYTFLVHDDYGYYSGNYAVSAFKSTGTIHADPYDIDGGAIASGASVNGSSNVGDLDIFRVNATAGQALTLRVNDIGGSSAWPRVGLYGPDGTFIAFDDNTSAAVLTHTPATSGDYTFVVYDSYGYYAYRYGLTVNAAALTTDTLAPRALGAAFGYNESTHPITIYFSEAITGFTVADVSVVNTTTGIQVSSVNIAINPGNYSATLTFPGLLNGRLGEGNYTLTLNNASVQDAAGLNLNGGLVYQFHVMTGDVNRDKRIDFDDLLVLAQNYGKRGRIFATGDINYSTDGLVNFDDLLLLAQRYGNTLQVNEPVRPRQRLVDRLQLA